MRDGDVFIGWDVRPPGEALSDIGWKGDPLFLRRSAWNGKMKLVRGEQQLAWTREGLLRAMNRYEDRADNPPAPDLPEFIHAG